MEKEIQKIKDNYKNVEQDKIVLQKSSHKMIQLGELMRQHKGLVNYLDNDVDKVLHVLLEDGYLLESDNDRLSVKEVSEDVGEILLTTEDAAVLEDKLSLSEKGKMASGLREVHCLVFAQLCIF